MMTSQILFSPDNKIGLIINPILAGQIMNTIIFFLPMEYRITLTIDPYTTLTFRFLAASWSKIHSHIVELLSTIFGRFHVPLYIP